MAPLIHGHTRRLANGRRMNSPEYRAYTAMKNRCLNKHQDRYEDYGGRGITVCDRWLHGTDGLSGFECFLADMGQKPSTAHSLERRNNDRSYEPDNCKWATPAEQNRNTRQNRMLMVCGEIVCLADAASFATDSPSASTIRRRLDLGWEVDDAVLTPVGRKPVPGMEVCF